MNKSIKRISLFACILILLTSITGYAESNAITIDEVKLDDHISEALKSGSIPGAAVAIVKDDVVLLMKGYGETGKGKVKITEETPFMVGQIAQSFTALVVRQLILENKIDENSPVDAYIPWFTLSNPDGEKISIADLLNHTSGLTTASGEKPYTFNSDYSLKSLVEKINDTEKTAYNGEGTYQYSALNAIILGHVVEAVTGQNFETVINERVILPLNLMSTGYTEKVNPYIDMASGHRIVYGFQMKSEYDYPKGLVSSSALVSTAKDLAFYAIAALNNGYTQEGVSILGSQGLGRIERSAGYNQPYYDLLWRETEGNNEGNYNGYYGAIGHLPNFNSAMILNQETGIAIIVLLNQSNPYHSPAITAQTIANDISDLLMGGAPYAFEPKERGSIWMVPGGMILLVLLLINSIIKNWRMIMDTPLDERKEKIKPFNPGETSRGLLSVIAYFGFPLILDSSWRFLTAASPEMTLPVLVIIVFNLLTVLLNYFMRLKSLQKV